MLKDAYNNLHINGKKYSPVKEFERVQLPQT